MRNYAISFISNKKARYFFYIFTYPSPLICLLNMQTNKNAKVFLSKTQSNHLKLFNAYKILPLPLPQPSPIKGVDDEGKHEQGWQRGCHQPATNHNSQWLSHLGPIPCEITTETRPKPAIMVVITTGRMRDSTPARIASFHGKLFRKFFLTTEIRMTPF